jgi:large subunit ribosomal protein L25
MERTIELRAEQRNVLGKKTRRLRKAGLIPAVLYGPRTEPIPLQMRGQDLRQVLDRAGTNQVISLWIGEADKPKMTLAREIQRDVITHSLLHVDLYEVAMTEKITADIPLSLVGEAPVAVQKAGLLVRGLDSVEVQCLPGDLVESIEVDVSGLERKDQLILVGDLVVDGTIEVLAAPEEIVVRVLPVRAKIDEELVEEEAEPGEVEVITAAKEYEEREPEEEPEAAAEEKEEQEAEVE